MMKKILFILAIILISCSSNDNSSGPQNLDNLPTFIENDGTSYVRVFNYDGKKLIEMGRVWAATKPYDITQPYLFLYDTSNRIEKYTDFFNQEIIFDIVIDSNGRITSYKTSGTSHTNRIDLNYDGNLITSTNYKKEYYSDIYELGHSKIYTIENGNIVKIEEPNYSVTEYFYDNRNSPFSNIDGFEYFQIIFLNGGVISIPEIYRIEDLFRGKNNLIKKAHTYLPTGEITTSEYLLEYNPNNYPTSISGMTIKYK